MKSLKEKKRSVWSIALVISLIAMLLASILVLGIDTSWGNVTVKTGKTLGENGTAISYKIYIPKTATAENPAPCLVWGVGGGDTYDFSFLYATEFSRRGFVVVSFDAAGNGHSDNDDLDATKGMETVYRMASALDYVDNTRMITGGHSMGGRYSMDVAQAHQDEVIAQIALGMNYWGNAELGYDFNFAYVVGTADESALVRTTNHNTLNDLIQSEGLKTIFGIEQSEEIVVGQSVGDFSEGTGRIVLTPNTMHVWESTSVRAVKDVLTVAVMTTDMPNPIPVEDTIVGFYNFAQFLIYLAFGAVALSLAMVLLETKLFETLKLNATKYAGLKFGSKGWTMATLLLIVLSGISFIYAYEYNDNYALIMRLGDHSGGRSMWAFITGAFLLIYTLVFYFVWGKKNNFGYREFGLATSNEKAFDLSYLLKALLYALAYFGILYGVFYVYNSLTQCSIHVTNFEIAALLRTKVLSEKPFLIVMFMLPYLFFNGMAQRTVVGFDSEDNVKNTLKSLATSTAICVLCLLGFYIFFVIMVYGFHTVPFYNNRGYCGAEDTLAMVLGTLIFNTVGFYINKKTGNNWVGLIVCMLLVTWLNLIGPGMAA